MNGAITMSGQAVGSRSVNMANPVFDPDSPDSDDRAPLLCSLESIQKDDNDNSSKSVSRAAIPSGMVRYHSSIEEVEEPATTLPNGVGRADGSVSGSDPEGAVNRVSCHERDDGDSENSVTEGTTVIKESTSAGACSGYGTGTFQQTGIHQDESETMADSHRSPRLRGGDGDEGSREYGSTGTVGSTCESSNSEMDAGIPSASLAEVEEETTMNGEGTDPWGMPGSFGGKRASGGRAHVTGRQGSYTVNGDPEESSRRPSGGSQEIGIEGLKLTLRPDVPTLPFIPPPPLTADGLNETDNPAGSLPKGAVGTSDEDSSDPSRPLTEAALREERRNRRQSRGGRPGVDTTIGGSSLDQNAVRSGRDTIHVLDSHGVGGSNVRPHFPLGYHPNQQFQQRFQQQPFPQPEQRFAQPHQQQYFPQEYQPNHGLSRSQNFAGSPLAQYNHQQYCESSSIGAASRIGADQALGWRAMMPSSRPGAPGHGSGSDAGIVSPADNRPAATTTGHNTLISKCGDPACTLPNCSAISNRPIPQGPMYSSKLHGSFPEGVSFNNSNSNANGMLASFHPSYNTQCQGPEVTRDSRYYDAPWNSWDGPDGNSSSASGFQPSDSKEQRHGGSTKSRTRGSSSKGRRSSQTRGANEKAIALSRTSPAACGYVSGSSGGGHVGGSGHAVGSVRAMEGAPVIGTPPLHPGHRHMSAHPMYNTNSYPHPPPNSTMSSHRYEVPDGPNAVASPDYMSGYVFRSPPTSPPPPAPASRGSVSTAYVRDNSSSTPLSHCEARLLAGTSPRPGPGGMCAGGGDSSAGSFTDDVKREKGNAPTERSRCPRAMCKKEAKQSRMFTAGLVALAVILFLLFVVFAVLYGIKAPASTYSNDKSAAAPSIRSRQPFDPVLIDFGNPDKPFKVTAQPGERVNIKFFIPRTSFYKLQLTFDPPPPLPISPATVTPDYNATNPVVPLSNDIRVALYGRLHFPPTLTLYDATRKIVKAIPGSSAIGRSSRSVRSIFEEAAAGLSEVDLPSDSFILRMREGSWYVSMYNDGDRPLPLTFISSSYVYESQTCPGYCSGQGECLGSTCSCFEGFTGDDCSQRVCPLVCNGNGDVVNGRCSCYDGWKGSECATSEGQCERPDCHGHGRCHRGSCICHEGWTGQFCDEAACPEKSCSGRGLCSGGECYCRAGYVGTSCEYNMDSERLSKNGTCVRDCFGHGTYNATTEVCTCYSGWEGTDCNRKKCQPGCAHGQCDNGVCVCAEGWWGALCSEVVCDSRCDAHGTCSNGTCICNQGYSGRHCTKEGCPDQCSRNGRCTRGEAHWECKCNHGWRGDNCGIRVELLCDNGQDDDGDSLIDCLDPDCCSATVCDGHVWCQTSPDPVTVLGRLTSTSDQQPFYARHRFLLDSDSTQDSARESAFISKQTSIVRGQVTMSDGTPLNSARISIKGQPFYGFTITRSDGFYDMLVNGGGTVTVQVSRGDEFISSEISVSTPWLSTVSIPTVMLRRKGEPTDGADDSGPECVNVKHNEYVLHSRVVSTWGTSQVKACSTDGPSGISVLPDSQSMQQSLRIPDTSLYLIHDSAEMSPYLSSIYIHMTQASVPSTLEWVHLRVSVEGVVSERLFEADPNLSHMFKWNKRDIYGIRVYGIVPVRVSVGYQYRGCTRVYWDTQMSKLKGHTATSEFFGGWHLSERHRYNKDAAVLYKGDGTTVYMKERPRQLKTLLGTGLARTYECGTACDGDIENKALFRPSALTKDLAGNLYVVDKNLLRQISSDLKNVETVLDLNIPESNRNDGEFHLEVSPVDGRLYISDYTRRRIVRLERDGGRRRVDQYEVVAGTGGVCARGSGSVCGDGGAPLHATFIGPRGVAIDRDGAMYIADGNTIRKIENNKVSTIIGMQASTTETYIPCGVPTAWESVTIGAPTSLAVNPVDNTLHVLDSASSLILKLTSDKKVTVIAGINPTCPGLTDSMKGSGYLGLEDILGDDETLMVRWARNETLSSPIALAFCANGHLIISESDGKLMNRIREVTPAGYVGHIAGASGCDCSATDCICHREEAQVLATKALLNHPLAVTCAQTGEIYVTDAGNRRVRSIGPTLPVNRRLDVKVESPETNERYVFDRFGRHTSTENLAKGDTKYTFTYHSRDASGVVSGVRDTSGHSVKFEFDDKLRVQAVTRGTHTVVRLDYSQMNVLTKWRPVGAGEGAGGEAGSVYFTYRGTSRLISTRSSSSRETYFFDYDNTGRLTTLVTPTGDQFTLTGSLKDGRSLVSMALNSRPMGSVIFDERSMSLSQGPHTVDLTYASQGSLVAEYPSGLVVTMETGLDSTPGLHHPLLVDRKLLPQAGENAVGSRSGGRGPTYRLEWEFSDDALSQLGGGSGGGQGGKSQNLIPTRHLLVNGKKALSVGYLATPGSTLRVENFKDRNNSFLLTAFYNTEGQPESVIWGDGNAQASMKATYDASNGALTSWVRGDGIIRKLWVRDSGGRLLSYNDSASGTPGHSDNPALRWTYEIGGSRKPRAVTLAGGAAYWFSYDESNNLATVRPAARDGASGPIHQLATSLNLGFVREKYTYGHSAYTEDWDSQGRLIRVLYPSGNRRVIHRYTDDGLLIETLYDDKTISVQYAASALEGTPPSKTPTLSSPSPSAGRITSISILGGLLGNYTWEKDSTSGALPRWQRIITAPLVGHSSSTSVSLANASVYYEYNNLMRVTRVRMTVTSQGSSTTAAPHTIVSDVSRRYDSMTGRLIQEGNYHFKLEGTGGRDSLVSHTGGQAATRVTRDSIGRIVRVQLEYRPSSSSSRAPAVLFSSDVIYDSRSRVASVVTVTKLDASATSVSTNRDEYVYNSDSTVREVRKSSKSGETIEQYEYDGNGNVVMVTRPAAGLRRTAVLTGERGRAEGWRGKGLKYDEDGFLVKKGEETQLAYNSLGLLERVRSKGTGAAGYDIRYGYDILGRVAARHDVRGNVTTQFLYADGRHPWRLTHAYDIRSGSTTEYLYLEGETHARPEDSKADILVGVRVGGIAYMVGSDVCGSPTALMVRDTGRLAKVLTYSLWGEVSGDSNEALHLHIGFMGRFYDPVTNLVFMERSRPYDPRFGRYLTAGLDRVFDSARESYRDPRALVSPYQLHTPLNPPVSSRWPRSDIMGWLLSMGYDLRALTPTVSPSGHLIPSQEEITSKQTDLASRDPYSSQSAFFDVRSAFSCAYERDTARFLDVSMVGISRLTMDPQSSDATPFNTFSQTAVLLGTNLVMSVVPASGDVERTKDSVEPISDMRLKIRALRPSGAAVSLHLLAEVLLNGSAVCLGLNYTVDKKVVHYLVKEDYSELTKDMQSLSIFGDIRTYPGGVTVRVERLQSIDQFTGSEVEQAIVHVTEKEVAFRIRYGATRGEEKDRVLQEARLRAEQGAWLMEQSSVTVGYPMSSYGWTETEREELKAGGVVLGYKSQYRRTAEAYPELADDPRNIMFVKK